MFFESQFNPQKKQSNTTRYKQSTVQHIRKNKMARPSVPGSDETQNKKAVSNVKCMLQAAVEGGGAGGGAGSGTSASKSKSKSKSTEDYDTDRDPLSERSRRLARELEDFVGRGMHQIMATEIGEEGAPSVESATDLQIQIARMFRQVC